MSWILQISCDFVEEDMSWVGAIQWNQGTSIYEGR
jgi:hypothetical protein